MQDPTVITSLVIVITLDLTLTIEINGVVTLVDHLEQLYSEMMQMVIVPQEMQGLTPTLYLVIQIMLVVIVIMCLLILEVLHLRVSLEPVSYTHLTLPTSDLV